MKMSKKIGELWERVLNADDLEEFTYWDEQRAELCRELLKERKKLYTRLRNRRYYNSDNGGRGRPRKYTDEQRAMMYQTYQHEYYEKVTKPKRQAERRKRNGEA